MRTDYDEKRDELKEKLQEIVLDSKWLTDESVWGHEQMDDDYGLEIMLELKNLIKKI